MDVYAYEEQQELREEQKRLHRPMKDWYAGRSDLSAQYGVFPAFWRDLGTWAAWKDVFREYNKHLERKASGLPDITPESAAVKAESDASAAVDSSAKSEATIIDGAGAPDGVVNSSVPSVVAAVPATAAGGEAGGEPRRKRKRWGDATDAPAPAPNADATAGEQQNPKKRKRWSAEEEASTGPQLPPLPAQTPRRSRFGNRAISAAMALIPPGATAAQEALFIYRVKVEELSLKLALVPLEAERISKDPARSPSPERQYDSTGKLLNSREQRMRKSLTEQRDRVLEKMMDLNPSLAGAGGPKFIRRCYIPIREYPTYNFMGLIIGPRGSTQKKLEAETRCKISVRGRGSGKEGKTSAEPRSKGRKEEDEDEMHVLITGEKLSDVEAAATLIADLLQPIDDEQNEWKKKQLIELAAINGTLRDMNAPCSRCGEPGHRHYECPYAESNMRRITIKCAICGDSSHVTADCKFSKRAGGSGGADGQGDGEAAEIPNKPDPAIEKEYVSFMAQLGDPAAKARLAQIEAEEARATAAAAAPPALPSAGSSAFPPAPPAAAAAVPLPAAPLPASTMSYHAMPAATPAMQQWPVQSAYVDTTATAGYYQQQQYQQQQQQMQQQQMHAMAGYGMQPATAAAAADPYAAYYQQQQHIQQLQQAAVADPYAAAYAAQFAAASAAGGGGVAGYAGYGYGQQHQQAYYGQPQQQYGYGMQVPQQPQAAYDPSAYTHGAAYDPTAPSSSSSAPLPTAPPLPSEPMPPPPPPPAW